MRRRLMIPTLVVIATLAACGGSDTKSAETRTTIVLAQAAPTLTTVDSPVTGNIGGQTEFIALLTRRGEPFGTVFGTVANVATAPQGRRTTLEERLYTAVFDLPSGQISVMGASFYDPSQRELTTGRPATRAIVGGTGKYLGARGEVTTTRRADGTYSQTITLLG